MTDATPLRSCRRRAHLTRYLFSAWLLQAAIRKSFKAEAEGRLEDALRAVDSDLAPAVAHHPIVRYRAGKVFMQRRSWAEAVAALHAACHGDPEQPGAKASAQASMTGLPNIPTCCQQCCR